MALDTVSNIATHLIECFPALPVGVSGNLVEIVDMARQHVENYTGTSIGSNNIEARFRPAILDFAKADVIDMATAEGSNDSISLAELSVNDKSALSAQSFRILGESKLRMLGRRAVFARSLS